MTSEGAAYDAVEVHAVHSALADLARFKAQLRSARAGVVYDIIDELLDGTLYLGDWRAGEIEITGISQVLANRFWSQIEYRVLFPPKAGGSEPRAGTYWVVRWNSGMRASAAVLPLLEDGRIAMLRCFRHATRAWALEIPRGVRERGETVEDCAFREAEEETGAIATPASRAIDLGSFHSDDGMTMQETRVIALSSVSLAGKVRQGGHDSRLSTVCLSVPEVWRAVESGEIADSFTCFALLKAQIAGLVASPR